MSKTEKLISNYEQRIALPWDDSLSGSQRVFFAIYDKTDERRLRARIEGFELATKKAGKIWHLCDITNSFADWMGSKDYKESYFEAPDDLNLALGEYREHVAELVAEALREQTDANSLVALLGVASLFGFARVSELVSTVQKDIRGRLLVFFPGEHENNSYRLLDARDGWNYLAVPITYHERNQSS